MLKQLSTAALIALLSASTPAEAKPHTVKEKENLSTIAAQYKDVSLQDIIKANHIKNPNLIRVGQILEIPTEVQETTYRVESGDSYFSIGGELGIPWKTIVDANSIAPKDLKPGDVLTIPTSNANTSKAQSNRTQTKKSKQVPKKNTSQTAKSNLIYKIQKGDFPNKIAKKNNINVNTLKAYNNHINWNAIKPGECLYLKNPSTHEKQLETAFPGHEFADHAHYTGGPHLGKKRSTKSIDEIVFHNTAGTKTSSAINEFTKYDPAVTGKNATASQKRKAVSIHYLIERDGDVVHVMPNTYDAKHAGKQGNPNSIGIEIEGRDLGDKGLSWNKLQLDALAELVHELKEEYDISDHKVVPHNHYKTTHNCPGSANKRAAYKAIKAYKKN